MVERDDEMKLMRRKVQSEQLGHMELVEQAESYDLLETQGAVVYPRLREVMQDAQKMVYQVNGTRIQQKKVALQEKELLGEQNTALPSSPCSRAREQLTRSTREVAYEASWEQESGHTACKKQASESLRAVKSPEGSRHDKCNMPKD